MDGILTNASFRFFLVVLTQATEYGAATVQQLSAFLLGRCFDKYTCRNFFLLFLEFLQVEMENEDELIELNCLIRVV